jgi:hypothetical protein
VIFRALKAFNKRLVEMSDNTIELFLQGEGIQDIKLIRAPQDCTVRELIEKARAESRATQHETEGMFLMAEDHDEELNPNASLKEVGIGHRQRIHCHRCRRIEVTVNFNGMSRSHAFPPSTTIKRIKRWADDQFGIKGVDATEHALQICGTNTRPDEDVHLGSLVRHPNCKVCFDLVPKKRVEG